MDSFQPHTLSTLPPTSSHYAPHHIHNSIAPHHSLPPLQPHHGGVAMPPSLYGQPSTDPNSPHTPNTPRTPVSGSQNSLQQMALDSSLRGPLHPPYIPSHQAFTTSAPALSQTSTAFSHQQSLGPIHAQSRNLVPLRPMPTTRNPVQPLVPSQFNQAQQQPGLITPIEPPTHVVGSQGRRSVLPSAPGKPPAGTHANSTGKNTMPTKDADGKYPCPNCNKTYLHAKHLKRHMLRHTGDRPYMCSLCRDTFSRSDILKRHFQKCSIRRGNPTGVSHLTHAQAHLNKPPRNGVHKSAASIDMNGGTNLGLNGAGGVAVNGNNELTGYVKQAMLSREQSISRPNSGGACDRRSLAGPSPTGATPSTSNRASYDGRGDSLVSTAALENNLHTVAISSGQSSPFTPYQFAAHDTLTPQGDRSLNDLMNTRSTLPLYHPAITTAAQASNLEAWEGHQMFQSSQDGFIHDTPQNLFPPEQHLPMKTGPPVNVGFGSMADQQPGDADIFNHL